MSEWKAIDTAPKDGTQVLLWSAGWEMSWGVTIRPRQNPRVAAYRHLSGGGVMENLSPALTQGEGKTP